MYASQSVSHRRHISLICFVLIFSLILSLSIPIEAAAAVSAKLGWNCKVKKQSKK